MTTQAAIDHVRIVVPVLLVLVALALVKPVGYIGGGGDDWYYLIASECWSTKGICLPHDHWSARWPLIAPMAAAMRIFGESRPALCLVPLTYAVATLCLFTHIVNRLFGQIPAIVAGMALVCTPVIASSLLKLNVDVVELCFILGAIACWLAALRSCRRSFALLAGIALAFAVQTRETSLAYLPAFAAALLFLSPKQKLLVIWALPGFLIPLIIESGCYWLASGDPLGRVHLALHHVQVPSTELSDSIDTSESPLFNPDFIAGWRPSNGIRLYWPIDPIINLLTHPDIGPTLLCSVILTLAFGFSPLVKVGSRRCLLLLMAGAAAGSLILIYGLCIDPKPRMFLPLVCAAAAMVGALASNAWRAANRPLLLAISIPFFLKSAQVLLAAPGLAGSDDEAAAWLEEFGPTMTLDETTRRHLALVAPFRAMPVDDRSRPLRLTIGEGDCVDMRREREQAIRAYSPGDSEPAIVQWTRKFGVGLPAQKPPIMCLFRQAEIGKSPRAT